MPTSILAYEYIKQTAQRLYLATTLCGMFLDSARQRMKKIQSIIPAELVPESTTSQLIFEARNLCTLVP